MKPRRLLLVPAAMIGFLTSQAAVPSRLDVFYFGNSLTGATNPGWHEELGRSAGREWRNWAWLGAGWQLWAHREELTGGRDIVGGGSRGDLTIDRDLLKPAAFHAKKFPAQKWDAVVLQLFGQHLNRETDEMWGKKLGARKDVGDLAAAGDLAAIYLALNPAGSVYVYQVWPQMEAGVIPPKDRLPEWARKLEKLRTAEFPNREGFNYESRWMQAYDPAAEKPWVGSVHRTRDFSYQVFRGLQKRFPGLAGEGRLRMIPGGDLFLELDRRMRAGGVPGCRDIRDFYTDIQHIRFGLPRYTAAALFYACLFREHPGRLDWSIYNDRAKYGEDPYHDGGDLLPITPDNARAVNDAIWQLLESHPHAGFRR